MGEGIDFREYLEEQTSLGEVDLREYSPLVLAYIGDAIYDLVIRTLLVERANCPVQKLHRRASGLVKASAQSQMMESLQPLLTEEETEVFKRGRNAKSYTKAKNATVRDYRIATGFEALMGYLYLKKDTKRMIDLILTGLGTQETPWMDGAACACEAWQAADLRDTQDGVACEVRQAADLRDTQDGGGQT